MERDVRLDQRTSLHTGGGSRHSGGGVVMWCWNNILCSSITHSSMNHSALKFLSKILSTLK